jgi:hypothetical protein
MEALQDFGEHLPRSLCWSGSPSGGFQCRVEEPQDSLPDTDREQCGDNPQLCVSECPNVEIISGQ